MTHAEAKAIDKKLDELVLWAVEKLDLPPEMVWEYITDQSVAKWEKV